jgi:broad specificity phosphatase PhoE
VIAVGILYMIRHRQASFVSANFDLLSETGVLQSRILAEYLLAVGLAPDALYSGAMERQKDTAGSKRILKEYAGRTVR